MFICSCINRFICSYLVASRIPPGRVVWGRLRRQNHPKGPKWLPKLRLEGPKWFPSGSKSALERSISIFWHFLLQEVQSPNDTHPLAHFWRFIGTILDQIWVKNRVKNRMSFQGRFFDPSKLIFRQILVSPNLDLKRSYSEFYVFSILLKIASESDFGSILAPC